jgi:hypothetical protein
VSAAPAAASTVITDAPQLSLRRPLPAVPPPSLRSRTRAPLRSPLPFASPAPCVPPSSLSVCYRPSSPVPSAQRRGHSTPRTPDGVPDRSPHAWPKGLDLEPPDLRAQHPRQEGECEGGLGRGVVVREEGSGLVGTAGRWGLGTGTIFGLLALHHQQRAPSAWGNYWRRCLLRTRHLGIPKV